MNYFDISAAWRQFSDYVSHLIPYYMGICATRSQKRPVPGNDLKQ